MNTRTTLVLALFFVALLLGLVTIRKGATPPSAVDATAAPKSDAGVTRNLLADPLGNVVKVAARRGDGSEWVFEKKDSGEGLGGPAWRMTQPIQVKALAYEVDRIGREIGQLRYEIAYAAGEPGAPSLAAAELDPPRAVVTLADDAGKSVSVEIGAPASETETYVRLAGTDRIVVAKANLRNLLKARPLDYRDQQLWNFAAENATRVEIVDRTAPEGPIEYAFTKTGGKWMMNAPVSAQATGKVDEMLRAFCRLRVARWESDDPAMLAAVGLDPAPLTIRVTVEETVAWPQKDHQHDADETEDDESGEETEPTVKKKTATHELRVSDRTPIGDESHAYVGVAGESVVGTVLRNTADKFKPILAEWRDMRLADSDATAATRVELIDDGGAHVLTLRDGTWVFESDGAAAEQHAVTELLAAIKGLKAVAFVETAAAMPHTGLESPRAVVRLTIPGVEKPETFSLGDYTDSVSRRIIYVRRNDDPVAKVKADDVAAILRPGVAYRDRTVLSIAPERVRRIELSTPNRFTGGRFDLAFDRGEDAWTMTAPVKAPLRDDLVRKLVATLASLRADSVVARRDEQSAYGLHDPEIVVTLFVESPSAEGDDESDSPRPPRKLELLLAAHDGGVFAGLRDGDTIYKVGDSLRTELLAEFRSSDVFDFDPADVRSIRIRRGDETITFVRADGRWSFEPEPDLPIDAAKCGALLADARELRADRFADHRSDDLAAFGLAEPAGELTITLADGARQTILVSEKTAGDQAPGMRFAARVDRPGVFLMTEGARNKLLPPLSHFEKR